MSNLSMQPLLLVAKDIKLVQDHGLMKGRLEFLSKSTAELIAQVEYDFHALNSIMREYPQNDLPLSEFEQLLMMCFEAITFRLLSPTQLSNLVTIFKLALRLYEDAKEVRQMRPPSKANVFNELGALDSVLQGIIIRVIKAIIRVATSSDYQLLVKYWSVVPHPPGTSLLAYTLNSGAMKAIPEMENLAGLVKFIPLQTVEKLTRLSFRHI